METDHPLSILLVEDDPDDALILKEILEDVPSFKFKMTHVELLEEAINRLQAGIFDIILLDLSLPDSHGIDTFITLNVRMPNVPIVVFTGLSDEDMVIQLMQTGAQDYLVKGQVGADLLIRSIRYAIERHRMRIQLEQRSVALEASETRFRTIITHTSEAIFVVDASRFIRFVNPASERMFEISTEDLIGSRFPFPISVGTASEVTIERAQSEPVISEMSVVATEWEGEQAYLASLREITSRKKAESALRDELSSRQAIAGVSEALISPSITLKEIANLILSYSLRLTGSNHGFVTAIDQDTNASVDQTHSADINQPDSTHTQYPDENGKYSGLAGHSLNDKLAFYTNDPKSHPDWQEDATLPFTMSNFLSVPAIIGDEIIGQIALANSVDNFNERDLGNISRLAKLYALALDRLSRERGLRESEEKFRSLIEQSNDAIYLIFDGRFELFNDKFANLFGVDLEKAQKENYTLVNITAPRSTSQMVERLASIKAGGNPASPYQFVAMRSDSKEIEVEVSETSVSYRGGFAIQGIIRDISERLRLEEQVRQATKMEAVGRLAGGVAHDFNNILTVISGHVDLATMGLNEKDPLIDDMKEIRKSTDRASDLTRQLLAFSRKQTLQPKILNLNKIIENMNKMLRRILGENVDLTILDDPDLGVVKVDPGQMEQVIANLVINARDAMDGSGIITMKTSNIVLNEVICKSFIGANPGLYVELDIIDSGCGMTPEIKAQIFEPFFTTKAEGKGTGLGLAMVYGIVIQSGGFLAVETEVDVGTTFRICFPTVVQGAAEEFIKKTHVDPMPMGTETILVVEDEEAVRELTVRILQRLGYNVLKAQTGGDAYMLCKGLSKPVDLVLTDVIMPNMTGPQLVEHLREFWTDVKILFMSGHNESVVAEDNILDPGTSYLQKPFRPIVLAQKIREVLD